MPDGPQGNYAADRVGSEDTYGTSSFTVGMTGLGHKEIEVKHALKTVREVRELLHNLTDYLLDNGPVIEDSHTIGGDEHERIFAQFFSSEFGNDSPVMRLQFEEV